MWLVLWPFRQQATIHSDLRWPFPTRALYDSTFHDNHAHTSASVSHIILVMKTLGRWHQKERAWRTFTVHLCYIPFDLCRMLRHTRLPSTRARTRYCLTSEQSQSMAGDVKLYFCLRPSTRHETSDGEPYSAVRGYFVARLLPFAAICSIVRNPLFACLRCPTSLIIVPKTAHNPPPSTIVEILTRIS